MNARELRDLLAAVPAPVVKETTGVADGVAASASYLASDGAVASIEDDPYWPKWDSPWWHMLALFEVGEARRIPARAVDAMVAGLDRYELKTFPIRPEDVPPGADPYRDSLCHCALGCMWQVLEACGVDVAARLPWCAAWFPAYQMADGGLNCDGDAYLVAGECPSSMVGTIAPFEAMIDARTDELRAFRDAAARFLVGRELRLGSATVHNAAERDSAQRWGQLCFPRFYFYDTLRGLAALVRWGRPFPLAAVARVATDLARAFPDGVAVAGRRGTDGWTTMQHRPEGWVRGQPATRFPLLDAASKVGRPSPALTRQWTATRHRLVELLDAGIVA
ncbi:MAG: hypothetical protein KF773_09325 [Deltaproteobacteria bacterium]|nr:hypothetical protein [Deltaproteobacteria bacterium]